MQKNRLPMLFKWSAAMVLVAASTSVSHAQLDDVDFGISSSTSMVNLPCFIAQEGGFFEAEGLNVSFVDSSSGSRSAAAVLSGDVGIACTGGSYAIYAAMRGQSLRVVIPVLNQLTNGLSVRNDVITERGIELGMDSSEIMERLKGATIGVSSAGSSTEQFAHYLINSAGLDRDTDFQIVPVGGDVMNVMAALDQGIIDATTFSSPVPEWIELNNAGRTVLSLARGDVAALQGAFDVALIVNERFAQQEPETVQKAVAALAEAQNFIHSEPDEAREIGARFLDQMDRDIFDAAFETIVQAVPKEIELMKPEPGLMTLITYLSAAEGEPVAEGITFDDVAANIFLEAYLER